MITKILFTILVVVGTILFFRKQRTQQVRHSSAPAVMSEGQKMFRQGAYLFMLFMVLSAIAVFVFKLGDDYATVNVHVINTQTGKRITYKAEQKDIQSNHFKTLEGRTVFVADIERIEVEPAAD
jgi:hypothetical protein